MSTTIAKPFKLSLIAAVGQKRELGFKNKLLWTISDDLKRFKTLTSGHPVIMGLKTYHSIGKPLPNRTNIVLSLEPTEIPGVEVVHNFEEAFKVAARAPGHEEVFIMGGGQVYTQAIALADKLYLTQIDATTEADTFFPDYSEFKKVVNEEKRTDPTTGLNYTWLDLERSASRRF